MPEKIVFVIASEGFQPLEYNIPKQILQNAGFEVFTASDKKGTAKGQDGSEALVDLLIEDVPAGNYDGLFFIGGPGALEHLDNGKSHQLLQDWQKGGKLYGAICISPRILAKAGVLKNKKATGWDGDGELAGIFGQHGVEYVREDVVADDNVITANGPMSVEGFGDKIVSAIKNKQ